MKPGSQPAFLRWAALPYTLLLASVARLSTDLTLQTPVVALLAVGTALPLVSDLMQAGQMFQRWRFPLLGDLVWLTYGLAQMRIVYHRLAF